MSLSFADYLNELSQDDYKRVSDFTQKVEEDPGKHSPWFTHLFGNKMRFKIPATDPKIKEIEQYISEPGSRIDWENGRYYGPRSETSIAKKLVKSKAPQELINWVSQLMNVPAPKRQQLISGNTEIVITRHPVDVLRMSDLDGIQSCHSPTGSYFNCAILDAKSGNMVAYLIQKTPDKETDKWIGKKSMDNDDWTAQSNLYDFEKGELFKDNKRKVKGIETAIARVRIRRFEGFLGKKQIQLAVPEERVYPDYNESFYETILNWAKESQKDLLNHPVEEYKAFNLVGGEYLDSDAGTLLDNLFGRQVSDKIMGKASKELARRVQQQEMKEIEQSFKFKHVKTKWEFHNENDQEWYFKIDATMIFDMKIAKNHNIKNIENLLIHIKQAFPIWTKEPKEQRMSNALTRVNDLNLDWRTRNIVLHGNENIYEPQAYRRFLEYFKILDDNYDQIRALVIEWLMHPERDQGQHEVKDVILKYFDAETQGGTYDKTQRWIFRLKNDKAHTEAYGIRYGTFYGSLHGGEFDFSATIPIMGLPKEIMYKIEVDGDYYVGSTKSPWKELLAMLPKNAKTAIHVGSVYPQIICIMSLSLTADTKTAEDFCQSILRFYNSIPYIAQQVASTMLRLYATPEDTENFWYFNKRVNKPLLANN